MKKGLLILNLGSPKSLARRDVAAYLQEFLMDPAVIDLAWPLRAFLVYGIISWSRPEKSAHAYSKIWDPVRGSPLVYNTENFVEKLKRVLTDYQIEFGTRYSQPSFKKALDKFKAEGIEKIVLAPMYPQHATSSSWTALNACLEYAKKLGFKDSNIETLGAFYGAPEYIDSFSKRAENLFKDKNFDASKGDFVLMSFHGIPERHIKKLTSYKAPCLEMNARSAASAPSCCDKISSYNKDCYRAQCFHTARELAQKLGLKNSEYSVSFQSRLGRTPWIAPYTDLVVQQLAETKKARRLFVFSPAFVADCLETLEEIAMREREAFVSHGGDDLFLVPSLNDSDDWVRGFATLLEREKQPLK